MTMDVTAAWLRIDLRRRWRSLIVLALLIAIAGATVMAALAGARRAASAQERLNSQTLSATSLILPNTPGFDWSPIRQLPEVAALTTFVVAYSGTTEGVPEESGGFPPADDGFMRTVEKPVIFSGRPVDPRRADEVIVTRQFVEHFHKGVGDTFVLVLATPSEVAAEEGSGPNGVYTGPRITMHIVGVGESSSTWGADSPGGTGGFQPSPGLYAQYRDNIVGPDPAKSPVYINALVRLRGGEADIPQLRKDIARITGRSDIEVSNQPEQQRGIQHGIAFEARCLLAFAIAAFVAALFLVGQAIIRYAAASTVELRTLRALGMSPRQATVTAASGPVVAGVLGAALAVGGAFVASRWFPIGSAGLLETDPGLDADWTVFGPGAAIVVVLVGTAAATAALLALGASRRTYAGRRSTVAAAAARGGLPVPMSIGTRFALEPGRGRSAVPVRPAIVGAVTGVIGIIAAFIFSAGVSDAADHPERFGQTYQLGAFAGISDHDFAPVDKLVGALRANSDVTGVGNARTAVATGPSADASVSLWAYASGPKALPVVVLHGRMPRTPGEVALAPRSVSALHTGIDRRVELRGNKGRPETFTVTGVVLIPEGPHNGYADGGWVTDGGYDRLFKGFKFHLVLITLRPSARTDDAATVLSRAITKADPALKEVGLERPDPLGEVGQLREVRRLPIFLGLFLVVLAIGAVGHALATAVRRRSHDLAVLRALGMTQRQCRGVVVTQATVLAAIGLAAGVPLGFAAGRSVWRVVADYTPIQYKAPTALFVTLLVIPLAIIVANALAAWPGRRAARLRISHILRTE
jgi:FtsX-like permease family protein